MTHFTKTEKNRIKRLPKRGEYDREMIYGILDEALISHVVQEIEEPRLKVSLNVCEAAQLSPELLAG